MWQRDSDGGVLASSACERKKAWCEAWLLSPAYHCLSPPLLPAFYQTAVPGIDHTSPSPKYPRWLSVRMLLAVWTPLSCRACEEALTASILTMPPSMNDQTTTLPRVDRRPLVFTFYTLPDEDFTAVSYSPAVGPDIRPSSSCRPVLYLPPLSSANRRVSGNFRSSTHTPSITSRHGPGSHLHKHGPSDSVGRVTTSVMSIVVRSPRRDLKSCDADQTSGIVMLARAHFQAHAPGLTP